MNNISYPGINHLYIWPSLGLLSILALICIMIYTSIVGMLAGIEPEFWKSNEILQSLRVLRDDGHCVYSDTGLPWWILHI